MSPEKPSPRKKCPACGVWISAIWHVIGGMQIPVTPDTCPHCHRFLKGRRKYHTRDQHAIDEMSADSQTKGQEYGL
jgi:hypothetical protein